MNDFVTVKVDDIKKMIKDIQKDIMNGVVSECCGNARISLLHEILAGLNL